MKNVIRAEKSNLLSSIDIFGVPILINYNNTSKHRTRFGGLVTLMVFGTLVALIINLLYAILYKQNPQVIQENLIQTPTKTMLNRENFIFSFALLDASYNPFMDETIYKPTAYFMYKVPKTNADGTIGYVLSQQNISLGPCTKDLFGITGLEDYFTAIYNYNQLYCIQNIDELYLVGQFESTEFSTIEIFIQVCQGTGCAAPDVIQNKIKNLQLQVYFSNYLVKATDYDNPFKPLGQSAYWNVNLNIQQAISFTYINTYVNDDVGMITSDIRQKKNLLFSQNSMLTGTDTSVCFFQLSLYMEKSKEQSVSRSYTKLVQAISQIGGIYNVLFFIGCVLAQPYSSLELKRKIVNSTFSFPADKKDERSRTNTNTHTNNNDPFTTGNQSMMKQSLKESKFYCQQCEKEGRRSKVKKSVCTHQKIQFAQSSQRPEYLQESSSPEGKGSSSPAKIHRTKSLVMEKIQGGFAKVTELTIRTREYFYYYFKCLKSTDMQSILHFGTDKISEFTDITFIVNKLLELEKLKHLILNEQQLKLFEYIPKPKITKDVIELHKEYRITTVNRSGSGGMVDSNSNRLTNLIQNQNHNDRSPQYRDEDGEIAEKKREFNILSLINRSDSDKALQAFGAYQQIYRQQKKQSKIDVKLLQLLDQNIVSQLNNSPDTSLMQDLTDSRIPSKTAKDLKIQSPLFAEHFGKKSIYYELTATDNCLNEKHHTTDHIPENFEVGQIEEVQMPPSQYLKLDRYSNVNNFSRPISELVSVESTLR